MIYLLILGEKNFCFVNQKSIKQEEEEEKEQEEERKREGRMEPAENNRTQKAKHLKMTKELTEG